MGSRSFKLSELAAIVGGELVGNGDAQITGAAGLQEAKEGDITFLASPRFEEFLETTEASAIIGPRGMQCARPMIQTDDPYLGFAKVLTAFDRSTLEKFPRGIDASAIIDPTAVLGDGAAIAPCCQIGARAKIGENATILLGAYIGEDVVIGTDCLVYPNVTICQGTRIGDRVVIFPGTVIGGDGFGFAPDGELHRKIPQLGNVVIEDDVEIGSNCAVDRATTGETRIGKGTKIDNLVHLGHNVTVGPNTIIAGQSGIAGSVEVGKNVTIAGQSGLVPHITIGDHVVVGGKSMVTKSIGAGMIVSGSPARDHAQQRRLYAYTSRLPDVRKRLNSLEKRIEELEKGGAHGKTAKND